MKIIFDSKSTCRQSSEISEGCFFCIKSLETITFDSDSFVILTIIKVDRYMFEGKKVML